MKHTASTGGLYRLAHEIERGATMKPFHVETTVDAPVETVWRYVTEPALIRDWFGWDYAKLDDEIQYIFVDHAEPRRLDRIGLGDQEIRLVADGGATRVQAIRPGDAAEAETYDAVEEGWRTFFEQLRFLLAQETSERRRTVFLSGTAAPTTLAGALRDGELWHESRHQLMTIDDAGQLVALVSEGRLDSRSPAKTTLTVSTFGLDDEAFAAVEQAWTTRWTALTAT